MTSQHIFHLALKLYARKITHAAYTGILGREPDDRGLESYAKEIATTGNLSIILGDFARSREVWERNFYLHPDELIRLIFQGLLGREPDAQALAKYADALSQTQDLSGVLSALAQSREHWEKLLGQRSEEIVRAAFQGLLEREPDAEVLNSYAGQLADSKDLPALLSAIGTSREHWEKLLGQRSEEIVRAAFQGLLERAPDAEALNTYAGQLADSKDLPALLSAIGTSRAHWEKLLGQKSEELVKAAFQGLLEREPDPEVLNTYAGQLADSKDLPALLSAIGTSREHWEKLLGQRSEEIVRAAFQGLLERAPDAEALNTYAGQLAQSRDLSGVLSALARSQEHWEKLLGNRSEEIVRAAFVGLLEREPDAEALNTYSRQLAEGKDLGKLLAVVGSSEEHWQQLLKQRSTDIIRSVFHGILSRDPFPEELDEYRKQLAHNTGLIDLIKSVSMSFEVKNALFLEMRTSLVSELFKGLLKREPDTSGLKWYSDQIHQVDHLSEIIAAMISSDEFKKQYVHMLPFDGDLLRINTLRKKAFVFVELEAFLPFILTVADYLRSEYGCEVIVINYSDSEIVKKSMLLSSSVFEVISYKRFVNIAHDINNPPEFLVTHSFAVPEISKSILDVFPSANLILYADGFLNLVRSNLSAYNPQGVIHFGYTPTESIFPVECEISSQAIFEKYQNISEVYINSDIQEVTSETDYSVVYLRYWDKGHYSMPKSAVLTTLLEMIVSHVEKDSRVILKDDPRSDPQVIRELGSLLHIAGFEAISFSEYLENIGLDQAYARLPVEYFYARNILCKAKQHFVLDSGLAFIVAVHPNVRRPCEIILGTRSEFFPASLRNKLSALIRNNVIYYHDLIQSNSRIGDFALLESQEGIYYRYQLLDSLEADEHQKAST